MSNHLIAVLMYIAGGYLMGYFVAYRQGWKDCKKRIEEACKCLRDK